MPEIGAYGSVRGGGGNILTYSDSAGGRKSAKRHAVIAAKAVSRVMTPPSDARPRASRGRSTRSLPAVPLTASA